MMDLEIRKAEENETDAKKMLEWRSDEEARKTALNKDIDWGEHWSWYKKSIRDQNKYIFFGVLKKEDVGLLRFESIEKYVFHISVYLAPEHRKKGIGPELIRKGCEKMFKESECKKIYAKIKTDNIISINAFEKANFSNKKIIKNGKGIPICILEFSKKKNSVNKQGI
jgi:RimJ/RimL family protein N-acetyltransferase